MSSGRQSYAKHASLFHRRVGEILHEIFPAEILIQNGSYKAMIQRTINAGLLPDQIDQEEMLKDAKRLEVDFMIPKQRIAIEVQGRQHYMPISFGGDEGEARKEFKQTQFRDNKKRNICKTIGWQLVEIPYDGDVTVEGVRKLIFGSGGEK